VQGVGALVVKKDVALKPLLYGGTGARSNELTPNVQMPESFEAGTQFTGGISALYQGAKWTYDNLSAIRKNTFRISKNLGTILKDANATIYTHDFETGVVSFNFSSVDSGFIADELNEYDVCVRSGLHCAPLVHERMGTATQGAVRASVGCDTTDNEINMFANILDKILRKIK
jgi:selenocysteine lyase/cysteine desulfurase